MTRLQHPPTPQHLLAVALVLVGVPVDGLTQEPTRIEILHAAEWRYDQKLAPGAQRLLGDVAFRHANAVMHCDSAHLFENNTVDAFGHVDIRHGDTLQLNADRLHYDGRTRLASLDGNVRLNDPGMMLETGHMDYDLRARQAVYTGGGRLESKREANTLTSDRGTYLAATNRFIFTGRVLLTHPERTITADTLHYTTTTGVAEFQGPTELVSGTTRMWCTAGTYDTRADQAHLWRDARVLGGGQELRGDTLHFDRRSGIGRGHGHVEVIDTSNGLRVRGQSGLHDQTSDRTWITGRAELVLDLGGDTLFLHGDTLFAETVLREMQPGQHKDTLVRVVDTRTRRITARRGARFFKSDLQGICDTLVYLEADSTIHLHHRPALWSGNDQITGDRIRITLRDGKAHRLYVDNNAFIASQVDSIRYDQVTGTRITGVFVEGRLEQMVSEGNCRTVYYAREGPPEAEKIIGMNRADCSRIRVGVHEGTVNSITFLTSPEAVMYPLALVPEEEKLLRGFVWRAKERPADRSDIFR